MAVACTHGGHEPRRPDSPLLALHALVRAEWDVRYPLARTLQEPPHRRIRGQAQRNVERSPCLARVTEPLLEVRAGGPALLKEGKLC